MNRAEQMVAIGGIAAEQWGLITAAQAKSAGLSGVQVKRLADAGLLESVGRGVYLLAGSSFPAHMEIVVAWLRLQPNVPAWERRADDPDSGVVSHASACLLHGLGDIPTGEVELTVPRRRATREPFVKLHIASLEPDDVVTVDGLPVTTVARTVVDLLRQCADGGHVGGVIAEADRRGQLAAEALAPCVARFAKPYGLAPTADGMALVEHLVAQAGENLRSQEIQRATRDGIAAGLVLAEHPGYTHQHPGLKLGQMIRTIEQYQAPLLSPGVLEALKEIGRVQQSSLYSDLQRTLSQAALPPGALLPTTYQTPTLAEVARAIKAELTLPAVEPPDRSAESAEE